MSNSQTIGGKNLRYLIVVAALIALALTLLFVVNAFLLPRRETNEQAPAPSLLGDALRAPAPEFEQARRGIALSAPQLTERARGEHNKAVEIRTTVSNNTGRTITGLEMRAVLLDDQNNIINQTTTTPVTLFATSRNNNLQSAIEPSGTREVLFIITVRSANEQQQGARVEITGIRLD